MLIENDDDQDVEEATIYLDDDLEPGDHEGDYESAGVNHGRAHLGEAAFCRLLRWEARSSLFGSVTE